MKLDFIPFNPISVPPPASYQQAPRTQNAGAPIAGPRGTGLFPVTAPAARDKSNDGGRPNQDRALAMYP